MIQLLVATYRTLAHLNNFPNSLNQLTLAARTYSTIVHIQKQLFYLLLLFSPRLFLFLNLVLLYVTATPLYQKITSNKLCLLSNHQSPKYTCKQYKPQNSNESIFWCTKRKTVNKSNSKEISSKLEHFYHDFLLLKIFSKYRRNLIYLLLLESESFSASSFSDESEESESNSFLAPSSFGDESEDLESNSASRKAAKSSLLEECTGESVIRLIWNIMEAWTPYLSIHMLWKYERKKVTGWLKENIASF